MLSQFLALERSPSEPLESYYTRRMRAVANLAHQQGDWGTQHAIRVCNWADHLERPQDQKSLAALMHTYHDAAWLEGRRLNPDIGGASRPGTRAQSGYFNARWDESVLKARKRIPQ